MSLQENHFNALLELMKSYPCVKVVDHCLAVRLDRGLLRLNLGRKHLEKRS